MQGKGLHRADVYVILGKNNDSSEGMAVDRNKI